MDLDHVAIAGWDIGDVLSALVGELGGRILHGGVNFGFRAMQIKVGEEGMNVELLEPHNPEQNDFLERFLQRSGPGPHHTTFKTADIRAWLERAEAAGFQPVGVNLAMPMWMEAFLHPKQSLGTVVQVAQSDMDPAVMEQHLDDEGRGLMRWWPQPPERATEPATLRRVVLRVPDLAEGLRLYRDLLDGSVDAEAEEMVELVWPSGGRVRLEQRPDDEPGVDRYEVGTLDRVIEVGGARFVPAG